MVELSTGERTLPVWEVSERLPFVWYRQVRLVTGRARAYRAWFPTGRAIRYAVRDRRRATGTMDIPWSPYRAPFRVRCGRTDLVTLGQVIGDRCYDLPFDPGEPRWIIDAGANAGYSAVWFAHAHPTATVVAVEPDADNFALLCHHAAAYPNIVPVQAALWATDGSVDLADPGRGDWGLRVDDGTEAMVGQVAVRAVSLPTLLDEHGIDRVDVLKIDIEGGETAVLADPSAWIDRVDQIAIELHDRFVPGCTEVFEAATSAFTRRSARGEDHVVARPEAGVALGREVDES